MTNILFIHPNYPGQFKHIVPALRDSGNYRLAYICRQRSIRDGEDILFEQYEFDKADTPGVHRYLHHTHEAVREARLVSICANNLVQRGFIPDIVIGHTGWGGLLFIRDMFPDARIIGYCELYFGPGFDHATPPGQRVSNDRRAFLRCRNLHTLMQMEAMDLGITPTRYQLESHPDIFHPKMKTIHEGVDTTLCKPDDDAKFPIRDKGLVLDRSSTVITYVSRGFEPARGFFQYMQALEILGRELPDAHFLLVGGDRSFYSGDPGDHSFREQALERVSLDRDRVHFTGRLVHEGFRKVVQVSSAHVYLTRPLFLSWSAVEAMAMGAPLVMSDEALVREFVRDQVEGLLVDTFDPAAIAEAVIRLVEDRELALRLGNNARKRITDEFDISSTVGRWMDTIRRLEN